MGWWRKGKLVPKDGTMKSLLKNLTSEGKLYKKLIMYKTTAEIIAYLDTLPEGGSWIVLDGVQALTTVTYTTATDIAFNPANGIVIKTFVNQRTGEIKLFPAKIFGFPDRQI